MNYWSPDNEKVSLTSSHLTIIASAEYDNDVDFGIKVIMYCQEVAYISRIVYKPYTHARIVSYATVQSQKAVSAWYTSKKILPFGFELQWWLSALPQASTV